MAKPKKTIKDHMLQRFCVSGSNVTIFGLLWPRSKGAIRLVSDILLPTEKEKKHRTDELTSWKMMIELHGTSYGSYRNSSGFQCLEPMGFAVFLFLRPRSIASFCPALCGNASGRVKDLSAYNIFCLYIGPLFIFLDDIFDIGFIMFIFLHYIWIDSYSFYHHLYNLSWFYVYGFFKKSKV